ncbi:MAG: DUF3604 domain-containing protein [Clostridia bacterium]|nr:DUF3604 domain-containing protein [Clostridia bacterium]
MNHPDKYKAKRFDTAGRCAEFTDIVYGEIFDDAQKLHADMRASMRKFDPPAPMLTPLIGEMHGHTNLSDGQPDIDTYFRNIRDIAKLDFAAISDHDHGGVGHPTLWAGSPSKWDLIREKVKEYNEPGKFSTLLAYERDSYPFYNNMVLYFRSHDAEMIRGVRDGELTEAELRAILAREDVIAAPHDTYSFSAGCDFLTIDQDLILPMIEIYSRADAVEYMDHPAFSQTVSCEGGFWQDALRRGAKMGVIGGSDSHNGTGGMVDESKGYPGMYPGVTGVWAEENTPTALFDAIRAKRTYAFMMGKPDGEMGGRMVIDFRINGHWMGETVTRPEGGDLSIYFEIKADTPIESVTLVKNCRNYIRLHSGKEIIFDYRQEIECDSYYLRVALKDGRYGWTSPIWVEGTV